MVAPSFFTVSATPSSRIEPLRRSEEEWRKLLSTEQFEILRNEGTEAPGSSELLNEERAGVYVCAGCQLALFDSVTKYESGTGWPSFYDFIPGHLETKRDWKLIIPRTEYHCARCGGHQGHVFEDGPRPTGLRYCNNGLALNFEARVG
jgi:peptide-methionine (R)-S-oxide reductase